MLSLSEESIPDRVGMPRGKKTRRGKRGKGQKAQNAGNPADHLKRAHDALASGDTATAKAAAFALVRALHKQHGGGPEFGEKLPAPVKEPEAPKVPKAVTKAGPNLSPNLSRLAQALRKRA